MQVKLHADYTGEDIGKPDLDVTFVAADGAGANSAPVDTAHFNSKSWTLPQKVNNFSRTGTFVLVSESITADWNSLSWKAFQAENGFWCCGTIEQVHVHDHFLHSMAQVLS